MSDVGAEDLVTLAALAQELPNKPHTATVRRWCLRGIRGIKLESVRVGGQRCISRTALKRFLQATNGDQAPPTIASVQSRPQASASRLTANGHDFRERAERAALLLDLESPIAKNLASMPTGGPG